MRDLAYYLWRVWMESKFNEIMAKIIMLFASGIAKSLGPVFFNQQPPVTPVTPQQILVKPPKPRTTHL